MINSKGRPSESTADAIALVSFLQIPAIGCWRNPLSHKGWTGDRLRGHICPFLRYGNAIIEHALCRIPHFHDALLTPQLAPGNKSCCIPRRMDRNNIRFTSNQLGMMKITNHIVAV